MNHQEQRIAGLVRYQIPLGLACYALLQYLYTDSAMSRIESLILYLDGFLQPNAGLSTIGQATPSSSCFMGYRPYMQLPWDHPASNIFGLILARHFSRRTAAGNSSHESPIRYPNCTSLAQRPRLERCSSPGRICGVMDSLPTSARNLPRFSCNTTPTVAKTTTRTRTATETGQEQHKKNSC